MKKILYPFTGIFLASILTIPVFIFRKLPDSEANTAVARKSKGDEKAPVQIVEYSDFQCPSCQAVQMQIHELLDRYPGKIYFIFKHFPLAGHKFSPLAHQSAECANEQGKFWEFHDRLYQDQMVWSVALDPLSIFLNYAKDLNLNEERFARCLENAEVAGRIQAEKSEGQSWGVTSTPTFFLNGTMMTGGRQFSETADRLIREKLASEK